MNYSDLSTEQQMIAETKKYVNNKVLDVQSDITSLQNNKVDKVAGKGLSTNDFTNNFKKGIAISQELAYDRATIPQPNLDADFHTVNGERTVIYQGNAYSFYTMTYNPISKKYVYGIKCSPVYQGGLFFCEVDNPASDRHNWLDTTTFPTDILINGDIYTAVMPTGEAYYVSYSYNNNDEKELVYCNALDSSRFDYWIKTEIIINSIFNIGNYIFYVADNKVYKYEFAHGSVELDFDTVPFAYTYGGGRCIALTKNQYNVISAFMSYDGIEWTKVNFPSINKTNKPSGLIYDHGIFLFYQKEDEYVITSKDGFSWEKHKLSINVTEYRENYMIFDEIGWGGGIFYACGNSVDEGHYDDYTIWTSQDGYTWEQTVKYLEDEIDNKTDYYNGTYIISVAQNLYYPTYRLDGVYGKGDVYTKSESNSLVIANPTDEAEGTLNKLKVNGLTYNLPQGGETNVQADWTETDSTSSAYIQHKPNLGTAASKDVPTSGNATSTQVVMGNDSRLTNARPASDVSAWAKASTKPTYTASEVGAYTTTEVDNKIADTVSQCYHPAGSKTCAELISSLLVSANEGNVYDMSDSGTTTSDFREGAGHPIKAGDNVGIVNVGTIQSPVYKFDLLSGFVDLSAYYTKTESDNKYVAKETGKGLSTNDYTTADKNKLAGIEAEANKTVVDSAMSDSSTNPLQNKVITKELEGAKTTSGNPITVSDAAPVNAVNLSMDLEPIQAGSGTPSPDNIRPISGRSEVAINRVGKNWLALTVDGIKSANTDGTWSGNTYLINNGSLTIQSDSAGNVIEITANGTFNAQTLFYCKMNALSVERNVIYNGVSDGSADSYSINLLIGEWFVEDIYDGDSNICTIPPNTETFYIIVLRNGYNAQGVTFYPMIRLSTETDPTYEPYQGKTYTIQLGDTVYGAHYDVTKGKMVVDKGFKKGSDLTWEYNTQYHIGYTYLPNKKTGRINFITSSYKTVDKNYLQMLNGDASGTLDNNGINIRDDSTTDLTSFNSVIANVDIVYELATPYTIDLTPQQIKMLENTNTLYTDYNGDTIHIEYQPNNAIGEAVRVVEENYETRVSLLENRNTAKVYGFHISSTESDPAAKVTYLADAVGMTPAHMNFSTGKFDYGSWENVWFVRDTKPCLLKDNGQIHRYLNKNNFLKDIDGNDTGVPQITIHTMIEFPKIWYKVVPDIDGKGASIYISPVKVDADYVDYPYIDYQGIHKEHFYMPAYNGSIQTESGTTYLCSTYGETVSKSLTAEQEIACCKAHGNGWNTEDAGSIMLINFLLILMGKSTDVQSVFGQGLHINGTEAINNGFTTGIHYNKGMFYGTNSGTIASNNYSNAVKVFGIENYWGFQWIRYAGDILVDGVRKIKLCYGNEDGSSTFDYNLTGNGYINVGATPSGSSGGYISEMKFTNTGMYSKVSSGSSSTHYCDGQWFDNSGTRYAFRGGGSDRGAPCGAFCVGLDRAASVAWWSIGVGLEYK